MESHFRRSLLTAVAIIAISAGPAASADRGPTPTTDPSGVVIEFISVSGGPPTGYSGGTGPTDASGRPCVITTVPISPLKMPPPPSPEHRPYAVYCNGELLGTRWIGPAEVTAVDPAEIAQRVLRRIPVGQVELGVRPLGEGIVAVPALFWVEGYDGAAINETATEFGLAVDVRVTLGRARWRFGDGTVLDAGLGERWPARSSVRHSYGLSGRHAVDVSITLEAEYRVNGGVWAGLEPLQRTAALDYTVNELEAVRNR